MFETANYLSLATFRKDGRKVATPVWAAPLEDYLVMFSDPNAGKVKRLRMGPRAELALCDVRGTIEGDWVEAQAFLIDDRSTILAAEQAMRKKYGWQSALLDFVSRVAGRLNKRQYIRIQVNP